MAQENKDVNSNDAKKDGKPAVDSQMEKIVIDCEATNHFVIFDDQAFIKQKNGLLISATYFRVANWFAARMPEFSRAFLSKQTWCVDFKNQLLSLFEGLGHTKGQLSVMVCNVRKLSFKDENVLSLCHLPYNLSDILDKAETIKPASLGSWKSFFERSGGLNGGGGWFFRWLFELAAGIVDKKKSPFLYDNEGNAGKSCVLDAIHRVFGTSATQTQSVCVDKFFEAELVNKILVTIDECKASFLDSPTHKRISGSTTLRAEAKGKDAKIVSNSLSFLFTSNETPVFPPKKAMESRLAIIEVKGFSDSDPVNTNRDEIIDNLVRDFDKALAFGCRCSELKIEPPNNHSEYSGDFYTHVTDIFEMDYEQGDIATDIIYSREITEWCRIRTNGKETNRTLLAILKKTGWDIAAITKNEVRDDKKTTTRVWKGLKRKRARLEFL